MFNCLRSRNPSWTVTLSVQSYVSACKALPGHAVRFVMRVIKYTQTYTFLYHASVLILLIGHICH